MVTLPNQTPRCEWYMVCLVVKNIHQKEICSDKSGLYVQNIDIILGSIVKIV